MMKPETMVIEMTDGTQFMAEVAMKSDGKLHVSAGGFMGMTFVLEPSSVRAVCNRLLELCLDQSERDKGWQTP